MLSLLFGLFITAFGAATLLPMQSEAVLTALIVSEHFPVWLLIGIASIGNILGAIVNWWLGRGIDRLADKKWFPIDNLQLKKYSHTYQRYGYWSLLLSWAPIIGDPLTVIAGTLKEPLWRFILIVSVAKTTRYLVVANAAVAVIGTY